MAHVCSRLSSLRPFARVVALLGCVSVLFLSAPDARAVLIGVVESYEGYANPNAGTRDHRRNTRYDRLVEALDGWKTIGVDFGVLVGDNLANDVAGWPLLLEAIQNSGVPVYLVLGNHDWMNTVPSGGESHPESCFNLKPQEQDPNCPNTLYFLDYLWSNYGYDRPWYSFVQAGVLFVFLADELNDPRVGPISDVHDEQFYWFRDLVDANTDKPIVVFAHHPVYDTVMGSNTLATPIFRLGWGPRVGAEVENTVHVRNGSRYIRASQAFDSKRVTVGAEFQIQGETEWYEISAISGEVLIITTPYQGPTDTAARYWAGGHFNELTQIMKSPDNSIRVIMSGHTSGDFQASWAGLSQMETISDKIFAYSGHLPPADIRNPPLGDFFVGSPTVRLTQTVDSYKIVPGASIRAPSGSYFEVADVSWPDTLGDKSTVTLASSPNITMDFLGAPAFSRWTEPFNETRVLYVDGSGQDAPELVNFNYTTRWRSGALLEGSFADPDFPSAELTDAALVIGVNNAQLIPTAAHGVALYGTPNQHFYSVEATLANSAVGGGGIAFRAQNGSNYFYFELDESSQTFKLGKCEVGVLTTLAEVAPAAPLVNDYTLKVRVQGSRIQTFVDDQPAIMFDDTSFPTGRYGLFSRSAVGSNFKDLEVIGDIEPFPVSFPSQAETPIPEPSRRHMLFFGIATLVALARRRRSWHERRGVGSGTDRALAA